MNKLMCNVVVMNKNKIGMLADQLISTLRTKFTCLFCGDVFKWSAPTFVSFAMVFAPGVASAAQVDYSLGGVIRSYPLGGVIEGESGYNLLLWGDQASPFHGYMRAKAYGSSAFDYNSLDGSLEFFPLAIFGIRAGGESIQNDKNYVAHDCVTYNCRGRFYRNYVEMELSGGYGPVFAQARWRRERWTQNGGDHDFIDPTSALALDSGGDSQTIYYGVLGYKFNDNWSLLGVTRYAEGTNKHKFSRFPYGIVRYHDGPMQIGVGGGFFESTDRKQEFSMVGFIKWEFAPSMALP